MNPRNSCLAHRFLFPSKYKEDRKASFRESVLTSATMETQEVINIELSDYWLLFSIDKASVYMDYLPYKRQSREFKIWTNKKLQSNFLKHFGFLFPSYISVHVPPKN